MKIQQVKTFQPIRLPHKRALNSGAQECCEPTDNFLASQFCEPVQAQVPTTYQRVSLPPERSDIRPPALDLSRSMAERNASAIAGHMKGETITTVAKEVSRVGTRLNGKVGEIIAHLRDSETRVDFASQALKVSGRMPMGPVMAIANALTPEEQLQVLNGSESSGYLKSCGFGKVEGPQPEVQTSTPQAPLLETPSGRPEVDARLKLALELGFSIEAKDGNFQVCDSQGRVLSDDAGPLDLPSNRQEWAGTARRMSCAIESATHNLVQETKLPETVKTLLMNTRSAKTFQRFIGLSEEEGKACATQLAALKAEVPNSQVPMLTQSDFDLVEPASSKYNCFAHTVGVTEQRIDKQLRVNNEMPILAELDGFYREYGYAAKHNNSLKPEPGVEKVLVYGHGETPTHVALLKEDGFIYSKLGSGALIRHRQPEVLFGPTYGEQIIGCYERSVL